MYLYICVHTLDPEISVSGPWPFLLQVSPDLFAHHHPHAPPLRGLGGGAVGTPHLYWLTPTYPGLWVVDWCQFEWGSVSRSSCANIGPAGSNTFCTDWTFFAPRLKQKAPAQLP